MSEMEKKLRVPRTVYDAFTSYQFHSSQEFSERFKALVIKHEP